MRNIHFITHPEVVIDPAVPVPDWTLSPEGNATHGSGAASPMAFARAGNIQ